MSSHSRDIQRLAEEFESCRKILLAFGDENRQHLILEMMQMGKCGGTRVGEITAKTHLSRPAVSHHIRILKESGLVKLRREGTKNYYYFRPGYGSCEPAHSDADPREGADGTSSGPQSPKTGLRINR